MARTLKAHTDARQPPKFGIEPVKELANRLVVALAETGHELRHSLIGGVHGLRLYQSGCSAAHQFNRKRSGDAAAR